MSENLKGRTAIVTGAGGAIGSSIATALATRGAHVVVADVDLAITAPTVDAIVAAGGSAEGYGADITDYECLLGLSEVAESRGGADILVNSAGVAASELVEDTDLDQWRRIIDVNLTGAFLCAKAFLPGMRRRRHGRIVNVASIAAKRISYNSGAAYTASKAGLLGFTRHLAYEAAPHGINVNAICPGPVRTPMVERLVDEDAFDERARTIPAGRLTTPHDQANAVLFLVSDAADMVFGQAIDVDGGSLLGWYDTATYFARRTRPQSPAHERI
ncbi:SDR family NAD(P)-dependent oxidoreductase [soil metagenome]